MLAGRTGLAASARRIGRLWHLRTFVLLLTPLFIGFQATQPTRARVAVLLSAKVDVYESAVAGLEQTLQHEVVEKYDMRGDFDRGRRLLEEIEGDVKPQLVVCVGPWALEVAVQQNLKIPIVYAMVLNPSSLLGREARNVTGASMNVSVERTLGVFRQLDASIRRVGIVYNPSNTGYLVADAEAAAAGLGLELVAHEASSVGEAVSALDAIQQQGIDALWIPPDKTVLAPAALEHMLLFSIRNRIPLLGLSRRHAEMGALLTLSFASSEDIGRQAGELANRTLAGRPASSIPYTVAREVDLTVNLKTAKRLGIEVPQSVLADAKDVIR